MIAESLPFFPWSGVAIAFAVGIGAGYAGMLIMQGVMRLFGHEGYVAESSQDRAVRVYMEKQKQGMRD